MSGAKITDSAKRVLVVAQVTRVSPARVLLGLLATTDPLNGIVSRGGRGPRYGYGFIRLVNDVSQSCPRSYYVHFFDDSEKFNLSEHACMGFSG